MTDIHIPATKPGRKKALTEAEALAAVTAANEALRQAQATYEKSVAALAAAKQAHDNASLSTAKAGDDLEAAEEAAAVARKALRNVRAS